MKKASKVVVEEHGMGILLVMFTVLLGVCKLAGWLSITWLWVFSPLWIPVVFSLGFMGLILTFCIAIIVFAIVGMGIGTGIEAVKEWKKLDLMKDEEENE